MNPACLLFAAALLTASTPADAHTVIEGVSGFPGGFLHPLLVPAHLLMLIALGLLAGSQTHARALVAIFALSQVVAVLLVMAAFAADTQDAILVLAAIGGGLLALDRPLPRFMSGLLIAAGGVVLMFDSVPPLPSVRDTLLALAGTMLGAALAFVLLAGLSHHLTGPVRVTGRRIVGAWVFASAMLVLALRFVK